MYHLLQYYEYLQLCHYVFANYRMIVTINANHFPKKKFT